MKVLLVLTLVAAATAFQYTAEWELWKKEHGRDYASDEEELHRHIIWESNKQYVDNHNQYAKEFGFTLAMNDFADLENSEFRRMYNGLIPRDPNYNSTSVRRVNFNVKDLPSSVDWRSKGLVTPIKNQGQCGSCWSFSATGSLEGQHAKLTGNLVSLSEQQLVDCSTSFGNHGCQGGLMDNAFRYLRTVKDDTEASYPYKAENGKCKYNPATAVVGDTGYTDIPKKDEDALQEAVANVGPISVAMDASHLSFQMYHSGVYNPWLFCSQTKLDHGVLAVGYGATDDGENYWIVKNSWGRTWGMDGYFMMKRGSNRCGIATQASYPTGVN